MDRASIVHENFLTRVSNEDWPEPLSSTGLSDAGLDARDALGIATSQMASRQLDRVSRQMQAAGQGFYTIGSSGHEGNAAIASAFRVDDMAFLHYRDCAFLIERARKAGEAGILKDILLSFAASADDPVSGGRHKVLGSRSLFVPPQTSTIASHLPKAMGAAFSIGLSKRVRAGERQLPEDGVILCSFGDASLNHSTAQGAINTAGWAAYQGMPMPIVFICEDNGIGISTRTPDGWVEASIRARPGLMYVACDGLNFADTYRAARQAEAIARKQRKPVFLHMRCVRLYGHAGADMQTAYSSKARIEADEANDPLLHTARILASETESTPQEILQLYNGLEEELQAMIPVVSTAPKLRNAAEVMASIVPPKRVAAQPNTPSKAERDALFGSDLQLMDSPQPMSKLINFALTDLMVTHGEIILAGEDIGPKGGVYGVTLKLHDRFGPNRVMNTLLDEQSILGLSIGLAHNGYLPIPEIQFLAYLHNAEDQLRGEAATLPFFSQGQFTNPMVVRIAGLGYQRGFGGHFHNDNSLAVLRDIPGIIIACPSHGEDAVGMLRECVRLAREEQRVCVFVEPIALYPMRDLHREKDGGWMGLYSAPGDATPIKLGEIAVHGNGTDCAIVTYGNGHYLSRQAQKLLKDNHGLDVRVIDMRWLAPLPEAAILMACDPCDTVLVVDECRITGSQSEALMAMFAEAMPGKRVSRLAAEDSFIPLGPAATATLPSRETIIEAVLAATAKS